MRNPGAGGSRTPSKTTPCCSKVGIKRGPWTAEEDEILTGYIQREGEGAWRTLPKRAGLLRCGKSCRLRWMNYLRPHLNRGPITPDEEDLILRLHRLLGNRWSLIAGRIPGRTDNEIKNYWNTHLSKKLIGQGLDPRTHKPLEIYNPNPNPNKSNMKEVMNDDARSRNPAQDSVDAMPNPILPTTTTSTSLPVMLNEEDALMTAGCNEDMYFSSFLDSLIMSDDCVFQDHSMPMMQPMAGNQGFVWGSDHEVSPLMASAFSESRNLDPRIDQRIGSGRVHVQYIHSSPFSPAQSTHAK